MKKLKENCQCHYTEEDSGCGFALEDGIITNSFEDCEQ